MSDLEHILPTSKGHGLPSDAPPKKRKVKKRAAPKREKPATGEFAGITAKACPAECTAKRCVISTVAVCHHPYKSSPNGAGPVTMANRDKAKKFIKHQMIDAS